MRSILKRLMQAVLVIGLLIIVAAIWKREEVGRLLAVNSLFSEEKIVQNFSNMDRAFLTKPMSRGDGPASALRAGETITLPEGAQQWLSDRAVTALVVLQDGKLRHESYHLGTSPEDRRISWSVAKSFLSALTGIVLEQGAIASLDDPVEQYAPALRGSAYEGASIRNVLNMSSGVVFNEDYLDFDSDINRMGRVLALGQSMDEFAAGLTETFIGPGETWRYVSIDTHIIGMVIRGATGQTIPDLLEKHVVQNMGFEADPYYLTDGYGAAFVLGGLNLRARDYARFGQMFLQGGTWNGSQIVPADWVVHSTRPSARTAPGEEQYGYQWWIAPDAPEGEYFARGIYGQYIFIDSARNVVIAANGADRGFREDGAHDANVDMFRAIAASMD
ncbi:beta-lactamase family protein [Aliiroseovarius sp. S1339]|uniref:serine hydrolase domain-containing protein n=1 Tax=Aliiroseovarius sp. S1339 TaxID=2936990 RepID=UPI0020C160CA|nr:serine hydrolase [Aliiroseovarius sp. S1339]MCK8465394.1 beta-lactamase family protein [Aliiroseovarius sp. S1339]